MRSGRLGRKFVAATSPIDSSDEVNYQAAWVGRLVFRLPFESHAIIPGYEPRRFRVEANFPKDEDEGIDRGILCKDLTRC